MPHFRFRWYIYIFQVPARGKYRMTVGWWKCLKNNNSNNNLFSFQLPVYLFFYFVILALYLPLPNTILKNAEALKIFLENNIFGQTGYLCLSISKLLPWLWDLGWGKWLKEDAHCYRSSNDRFLTNLSGFSLKPHHRLPGEPMLSNSQSFSVFYLVNLASHSFL